MKTNGIKVASLALLMAVATLNVNAQAPRKGGMQPKEKLSAEKMAEIQTDKLDQTLELTDKQESQIFDINLKYANLRADRPERPAKDNTLSELERKAQMQEQREKMKETREAAQEQKIAQMREIMAVLDDNQKIDYALFISKSRGDRRPEGPRGGEQRKGGQQKKGDQRGPRGGAEQDAPRQME